MKEHALERLRYWLEYRRHFRPGEDQIQRKRVHDHIRKWVRQVREAA